MSKLQWIRQKIKALPEAVTAVNAQRVRGKKIVFTNGCFDILHHGHLDLLAKAADEGNILIVGINTDASVKKLKGEKRPVNTQQDRAFQVASLLCVDMVVLFDEDTPLTLIEALRPDVLVKGGDYTFDTIVGAKEVSARGGKVAVIPFVSGYSTTGLIDIIRSL
ncbi:D-glycero-beta-D-manno-heptose 1-phosphate adenylyltransferase [Rurimicrobium arvi]|uniref:D-glycero-beta-D-manno-heptose 1-phosphate adenylyltransferase n=1 Tax=Rurimicrobium arvi TaxID=2049916 RepID=A0ABP8MD12_9BACT